MAFFYSELSDSDLAGRFVELTSRYSLREAAKLVGVSHTKVGEWRNGEVAPLQPSTRRAIEDYLAAKEPQARAVVRERASEYGVLKHHAQDAADLLTDDMRLAARPEAQALEELLDLMDVEGGLRRAFREHEPKDLLRLVYRVAIDDGWPKDKMAQLDALRERILGR